jgi:RNA polymerase sigma factor (sigma-70 family)
MVASLSNLLHHLRRLSPSSASASDTDLLARFVRDQDEAAFAALVVRHGPMVLNACQRVLGHAHDAEDACQATFLVLARKANAIGQPATLAGWLYGVASRIALKGRTRKSKDPSEDPDCRELVDSRPDPLAELTGRELLRIVEEEIQRLPQTYRLPIVLCCLEGLSQEEAASRLDCTPGSLKGRLERGRARLQQRLARRGLSLSAALAAVEVSRGAAAACLPTLVTPTVKAAMLFATRQAGSAMMFSQAAALAEGVLSAMLLRRLAVVIGLVLTVSLLGFGAALFSPSARPLSQAIARAPAPELVRPSPPGEITNSLKMKFRLIPRGRFRMGSPREEQGRGDDEEQHEVEITRPFYLGIYTVTEAEYTRLMGANPSHEWDDGTERLMKGLDTSRFPVTRVSWHDAVAFCAKLSSLPAEKKARRTYRLPTEAEWEYACRAGTTTVFHCGNSLSSEQANCNGNYPYRTAPWGPTLDQRTTVGSYKPNPWGLYDMHGNVWQWCSDWYSKDYHEDTRRDPRGPESGVHRVMRGGVWNLTAEVCRSAKRIHDVPGARATCTSFRVVCTLP